MILTKYYLNSFTKKYINSLGSINSSDNQECLKYMFRIGTSNFVFEKLLVNNEYSEIQFHLTEIKLHFSEILLHKSSSIVLQFVTNKNDWN